MAQQQVLEHAALGATRDAAQRTRVVARRVHRQRVLLYLLPRRQCVDLDWICRRERCSFS